MKKLLITMILVGAVCFGADYPVASGSYLVSEALYNFPLTCYVGDNMEFDIDEDSNIISVAKLPNSFLQLLEVQKRICEVYGHRWLTVEPNGTFLQYCDVKSSLMIDENGNVTMPQQRRKCSVCGRVEVKKSGWRVVE